VNVRSASITGLPTSFPRVRKPATVLLAQDLKTLMLLLVGAAKRLGDRGHNDARHATIKQNCKWNTNISSLRTPTGSGTQLEKHN
jgi:hypothetical protein